MHDIVLDSIEAAIQDIREGKIIIVVDDEDRENEGDFITSAELITPEKVNFMATHGRGLICVSLPEDRCDSLNLGLMVWENTSLHATPFTVSVDLVGDGCTTGISTQDRAKTIRALVDEKTNPSDLARPGHIFPLRARTEGVLVRTGHTEATVDLMHLAGLKAGWALVEIMNEDGTMARLPELMVIAEKFGLKVISIEDLIAYRLQRDSWVEQGERIKLPTEYGDFDLIPFRETATGLEHTLLIKGEWDENESILVRVHSSCITGDIFGSQRCDCGAQLHEAMRKIDTVSKGVILYINQEGRGIGYFNKMKAYKLQEQWLDTVEANRELGFQDDERDYGIGAQILRTVGVKNMKLMTNNPVKKIGLEGYGLHITEVVPLQIEPNEHNAFYMKTKRDKLWHKFNHAFLK